MISRFSQNSRLSEESKIVSNWIKRVKQCLTDDQLPLYFNALCKAGISDANMEQGKNLKQMHVDIIINELRKEIPELTLLMMRKVELMDLGIMGYAAINSKNVSKALTLMNQYLDLTTDRYSEQLIVDDQIAILKPIPRISYYDDFRNIVEDSFGGMKRTLEILLGDKADFSKTRVYFEFSEHKLADCYTDFFQCPCHFNAKVTEFHFPANWLKLPISAVDDTLSDVCVAMCERVLGLNHETYDILQVIRRLLLSRSGRLFLSLEHAAEALNMSSSQLRKRLYKEGTSYKKLVLETRMELARHYLINTNLAIQEIAYLLDYSQAAPFSRAFKDYFNESPKQFRESQ